MQVSTFLSELEAAAGVTAEGGPDSGPAVARLLRAVAGVRDQVHRFSTERSGLQARAIPARHRRATGQPIVWHVAVLGCAIRLETIVVHGLWLHGRDVAQGSPDPRTKSVRALKPQLGSFPEHRLRLNDPAPM